MARKEKLKGKKVLGYRERELAVKLTARELADRAQSLAQVEGKLRDHIAETKEIVAGRKGTRDSLENELRRLGQVVRSGQEVRSVETRIEADFAADVAKEYRTDTEEVIDQRKLTNAERQDGLFDKEANEKQPTMPPARPIPPDQRLPPGDRE